MMTLREAAQVTGVEYQALRIAVQRGTVQAHKSGAIWLITLDEAERYADYYQRRKGRQPAREVVAG